MFGEALSDHSTGHIGPLLDLCKTPNGDDGCRVNHDVKRLVALSVPGQVVILGMKTQGQNEIVRHQDEYTEHLGLILLGEWVSPRNIPTWGSEVGGEHFQLNSYLIIWITQIKPKLIKQKKDSGKVLTVRHKKNQIISHLSS